jgi:transposase-like protein
MSEEKVVRGRRRRTSSEIQELVSEFESGDLTQVEFCRRHGLVQSTLGRYLRRERVSSEAKERGLVAVELVAKKLGTKQTGCGLSVMVGSERRIVVESDFDAASLQRLVQVLEEM